MSDLLDRAGIAALIPHAGTMCLLDAVEHWDAASIRCRSGSHRDPGNPLRGAGQLSALSLIEYGAQASAVHGGLLAGAAGAVPGRLASVRSVVLAREWLDGIDQPLVVVARQRLANAEGMLYDFEVSHGTGIPLASGRIAVMLLTGTA